MKPNFHLYFTFDNTIIAILFEIIARTILLFNLSLYIVNSNSMTNSSYDIGVRIILLDNNNNKNFDFNYSILIYVAINRLCGLNFYSI